MFLIRLPFKTVRIVGVRRLFWIGLGVAVGLAVAPGPGYETRERFRRWLDEQLAGRPISPVAEPPDIVDVTTYSEVG